MKTFAILLFVALASVNAYPQKKEVCENMMTDTKCEEKLKLATNGVCNPSVKFMCKKACGLCTEPKPTQAPCADKLSFCQAFKDLEPSHCTLPSKESKMRADCAKTCGFCGKEEVKELKDTEAWCTRITKLSQCKKHVPGKCAKTCADLTAKGEPEATKSPPKTEEDDCIGLSCMEKEEVKDQEKWCSRITKLSQCVKHVPGKCAKTCADLIAKGEPEATKPPPKTEEDDCIGLSCMEKEEVKDEKWCSRITKLSQCVKHVPGKCPNKCADLKAKGEPEATKPPPKTEEDDCIGLSCMGIDM